MVGSDASIPKDTFHAMDWTNRQQKVVNISCADCNPTAPQSSIFNAELRVFSFWERWYARAYAQIRAWFVKLNHTLSSEVNY